MIAISGASPGPIRVRALSKGGLKFVEPGMVFDGERCPERPKSVWVPNENGTGFRLNEGSWEPVVEAPRRARRLA